MNKYENRDILLTSQKCVNERPSTKAVFCCAGLAQWQSVRKQDMVQVHYPAFEFEGDDFCGNIRRMEYRRDEAL